MAKTKDIKPPLLIEDKKKQILNHITFVNSEGESSKAREALTARLNVLSEYIDNDIVWITCHSCHSVIPKKLNHKMHIFSMMTPSWVPAGRIKKDSYTLNGDVYTLPHGQKDYLDPSIEDIPNCDGIHDEEGILMALIYGYNLYILNDIMHCSCQANLETAIKVFEYIIDHAVRLWSECEQ